MKNSFKYSLLIILTLLIATSLVNAQPVPIGQSEQARPYESNPTVATGNVPGSGAERDGSLATSWAIQGPAAAGSGSVFISGFTIPPPAQQFTIGWVDLKIKYRHPGTGDDGYHMGYKTSGPAYAWLQSILTGPNTMFDTVGNPAVRPWSNLVRTGGGAWTWADVSALMIRIIVTRGAGGWQAFLDLYEVWLTVYESAPPISSIAMSLMPGTSNISIVGLLPGKYFFVDVYVNRDSSSPGIWGYQATIKYDESVVTATQYFTYWNFTTAAVSTITPGVVSVSYSYASNDKVGWTGLSTPLCRIYFQVDTGGATPLDLIRQLPTYITELTDPFGNTVIPPLYDSWFSSPRYLSAQSPVLIDLANPLTTVWHEEYPEWSKIWHLTSWEDVSPDNPGELGHSDQIDMTNETGWTYWFHVDEVTITIHWTIKDEFNDTIPEEIGAAEPEDPMLTMPPGSPIGSRWHMIYPVYSQMIEITSWEDTDDSGNFNPSDQFDFTYVPGGDVVLVGPVPPVGAPLTDPTWTGQQVLYYDANTNGVWDVGEPAIDDTDWDGWYTQFTDTLLGGPDPVAFVQLSWPAANDWFEDTDASFWWDVGEPAIRDVDFSGTYSLAPPIWAHLDNVTTDILVSEKPIPPVPGPIPEFPFGISLLMLIVPIVPLAYLWRLRKKVPKH